MRLKRAGLLTKLVIVVLLVYLATSLLDLRGQIQSVQEERDTLEQQVEELVLIKDKHPILGVPFIRGVFNFCSSMATSKRAKPCTSTWPADGSAGAAGPRSAPVHGAA